MVLILNRNNMEKHGIPDLINSVSVWTGERLWDCCLIRGCWAVWAERSCPLMN